MVRTVARMAGVTYSGCSLLWPESFTLGGQGKTALAAAEVPDR